MSKVCIASSAHHQDNFQINTLASTGIPAPSISNSVFLARLTEQGPAQTYPFLFENASFFFFNQFSKLFKLNKRYL